MYRAAEPDGSGGAVEAAGGAAGDAEAVDAVGTQGQSVTDGGTFVPTPEAAVSGSGKAETRLQPLSALAPPLSIAQHGGSLEAQLLSALAPPPPLLARHGGSLEALPLSLLLAQKSSLMLHGGSLEVQVLPTLAPPPLSLVRYGGSLEAQLLPTLTPPPLSIAQHGGSLEAQMLPTLTPPYGKPVFCAKDDRHTRLDRTTARVLWTPTPTLTRTRSIDRFASVDITPQNAATPYAAPRNASASQSKWEARRL